MTTWQVARWSERPTALRYFARQRKAGCAAYRSFGVDVMGFANACQQLIDELNVA